MRARAWVKHPASFVVLVLQNGRNGIWSALHELSSEGLFDKVKYYPADWPYVLHVRDVNAASRHG